MSTISNWHLFFLVLAATPFSFSGVLVETNGVASASVSATVPSVPSLPSFAFLSSGFSSTIILASQKAPPAPSASSVTISQSPTLSGPNSGNVVATPPASQALSQTQPATSKPSNTASLLPSPSQTQSPGQGGDIGDQYGKVTLRNNCGEPKYLSSVGARKLGGFRNETQGYAVKEDETMHTLQPGDNYTEPYRATCPVNSTPGYCPDQDKLRGQAVSIKISNNQSVGEDILQFEYALVQNPDENVTYHRLYYDVSLLDCAKVGSSASAYGVNLADADHRVITDANSTDADHQLKVEKCPGYQGGLSVTFVSDTKGEKCQPIICDGKTKCPIYYFDVTRKGEPSMACTAEYKGDVVLDLCAGKKAGGG